jgi:flagellar basal body-associated protein FliL
MKRLLPLAILLLALGAAGLSVNPARADEDGSGKSDVLTSNVPKPPDGSEEGEGGGGKSKGPSDVTGGRFAGDPIFVHLDPMVLPVISDKGVEQLVTIQIDIEVKDFDAADAIHTQMPRVVDALEDALYGGLGQGSLRDGKLVDVRRVKAKATAALDEVIGADNIRDVLIQDVSQRML